MAFMQVKENKKTIWSNMGCESHYCHIILTSLLVCQYLRDDNGQIWYVKKNGSFCIKPKLSRVFWYWKASNIQKYSIILCSSDLASTLRGVATARKMRLCSLPVFEYRSLQAVQQKHYERFSQSHTHSIHVWYIYLHLVDFLMVNVGKYTSPMDPIGQASKETRSTDELN